MKVEYFEVEGAVFRKRSGEALSVFNQKSGGWSAYSGDASRVYRQSNPMSLEEVRPHMDVEPQPEGAREAAE